MKTPPAARTRTVSRKHATKPPDEQRPPMFCPHVDAELDSAVAFDVVDFDDLRLMSALAGESPVSLPVNACGAL